MPNYTTIKFETRNKVAWLTVNRPEVKNAFNATVIAEIADAFRVINERQQSGGMLPEAEGQGKHVDITRRQPSSAAPPNAQKNKAERQTPPSAALGDFRAVVLTGAGDAFCAGADLNWMRDVLEYSYEENLADSLNLAEMFHLMFTCPLPTIARVNGAAIGGGCGLAAVCDIVIASEKAIFSLSEVKLGLVPACISPYVIRRMGDKNCREYFLTGERLTAQKAFAAGLANQVVPPEKLDEVVDARINQLLSSGPEALAWCKQLLDKAPSIPEPEVGKYTAEVIARLRMGDEGQEGMKAFFEKRRPKWAE